MPSAAVPVRSLPAEGMPIRVLPCPYRTGLTILAVHTGQNDSLDTAAGVNPVRVALKDETGSMNITAFRDNRCLYKILTNIQTLGT